MAVYVPIPILVGPLDASPERSTSAGIFGRPDLFGGQRPAFRLAWNIITAKGHVDCGFAARCAVDMDVDHSNPAQRTFARIAIPGLFMGADQTGVPDAGSLPSKACRRMAADYPAIRGQAADAGLAAGYNGCRSFGPSRQWIGRDLGNKSGTGSNRLYRCGPAGGRCRKRAVSRSDFLGGCRGGRVCRMHG